MGRRKFKYEDYNKSEPYADATKYFIVYEGKVKEPNYFEAFNEKFIDKSKAFICHILEEDTGVIGNTPLKLKERAEKFISNPPSNIKVTPYKDDKIRFVIDVDKHGEDKLNELIDYSERLEDAMVFISNYCFEVWLWSHIEDLSKITSISSKEIKRELPTIHNLNFPHDFLTVDRIKNAVKRNKELDNTKNVIPDKVLSKVYLLIEELLEHSFFEISVDTEEIN